MATDKKIPKITDKAFSVFINSAKPKVPVSSNAIFSKARINVPPSNSKTIDTVVEVGIPNELKTSSSTTSVTMTARKMHIKSLKENICGWKIP